MSVTVWRAINIEHPVRHRYGDTAGDIVSTVDRVTDFGEAAKDAYDLSKRVSPFW